MKRDWASAEPKRWEGCRVGYYSGYDECAGDIELAHTAGRKFDEPRDGEGIVWVDPSAVVPLCKKHHMLYDARSLSIVEFLTLEEQAYAAGKLGLVRALRRVSPTPHEGEAT